MKKFIVGVLFFSLIVVCGMKIFAVEQQSDITYDYEELGVEIVFRGNTAFDEAQRQRIADILANDITPVEQRAWCWLLGHEYIADSVSVITHKKRDYNPRCSEDIYKITTCANCSYYEEELLGSQYIVCCPEE